MRARALVIVAPFVLLLAACGGGATDDGAAPAAQDAGTGTSVTTDPAAPGAVDDRGEGTAVSTDDAAGVEVTGSLDEKPTVTVPGGEPPADLRVVDLVEGDGEEVQPGAEVTIHYVGVSWLNQGQEFDASWDSGAPATFPLGQLIPGWQEGIPGMKPGGRRLLVIPPELGYGPSSPTPAIAPNDTLVFVIDLIEAA